MSENDSLFDNRIFTTPLASRMRPETLEDFAGQKHLLDHGKVLRNMIDQDNVQSMIFWGPPGVGKTTLAKIIAKCTKSTFINFSAVTSGIKEIRDPRLLPGRREGRRHLLVLAPIEPVAVRDDAA